MKRIVIVTCTSVLCLVVLAGSAGAGDLTWNVPYDEFWDLWTENWTGDSTTYSDGDNVTFDLDIGDPESAITVTVYEMSPGSTTVNSSGNYTFVSGWAPEGAPSILSGPLVKDGTGTLQLGDETLNSPWQNPLYRNDFESVTVDGGTLKYASVQAFGAGTVTMAGGTTLWGIGHAEGRYNTNGENLDNPFVLSGGNVNLPLGHGTSKDIWFNGVVSGPGGLHLTGTHRAVSLSNNNTFAGGVIIESATPSYNNKLQIGSYTGLGTGTLTVNQTLNDFSSGLIAVENLDGVDPDQNGVTSPGGVTNAIEILADSYLNVSTSNSANKLLLSGVISGDGVLHKTRDHWREWGVEDSTVIISGANTYTGGTLVTSGTLTIDGSLADSSMTIDITPTNEFVPTPVPPTVNGSGTLTFNIDGATNDLIQVMNFATLDITALNIDFNTANLTEPAYVLVDAAVIADPEVLPGNIVGTEFASAASVPGYMLDYDYDGLGTQIALVEDGTGTPGDFDGDGDVDGADFLMWQQGFGTTYDATHLAAWKANYGTTGSGAASATAVPEPASLALLGLGGLLLLLRRRRA